MGRENELQYIISDIPHDLEALDVPSGSNAERFYHGIYALVFPGKPSENINDEARRLASIFRMGKNNLEEQVEEARYFNLDGLADYALKTYVYVAGFGNERQVDYWQRVDEVAARMLDFDETKNVFE